MRSRPPVATWAVLALGALLVLAPIWFTFVFATHQRNSIFNVPPPLGFGDAAGLNFELLLAALPFWRNLAISLYVATLTTVLNLVLCSAAGYAFALLQFRGRDKLFTVVLGTMMVPSFLNMIPSFMVMQWLGWLDQPRALYVPAGCGALGVFLMRQAALQAVPRELLAAARMDGAGEWRTFWSVVLPLLRPALGTLALITFIASWNNFMAPLVVMRSVENYTLPLALRAMQSPNNTEWGALMLGSALALLPLLIVYLFSARKLVAGIAAGAVK
jgi:multiple sugar transport system permease protein